MKIFFNKSSNLLASLLVFPLSIGLLNAQDFTENLGFSVVPLAGGETIWADLNNDGLKDLFITGYDENNFDLVKIYRNNGNSLSDVTTGIEQLANTNTAFGDYNNDGLLDFVFTGINSYGNPETMFYQNNDLFSFSVIDADLLQVANGAVVLHDLNSDGFQDIILSGYDSLGQRSIALYANSGTNFTLMSDTGLLPVTNGLLKVFRYDNDLLPDLLISGISTMGTRITRILRNEGGFSFTDVDANSLVQVAFSKADIGDINGDGRSDILLQGRDLANNIHLVLYENLNGIMVDIGFPFTPFAEGSVTLADLNHDGLDDVITNGFNVLDEYKTSFWINNGDDTFNEVSGIIPGIGNGTLALNDFTGDNALDIFITGLSDVSPSESVIARFYETENNPVNNAPAIPSNLQYEYIHDTLFLSWDAPEDDLTHLNSIHYNLYLGNQSESPDAVSCYSLMSSGTLKTNTKGNAAYSAHFYITGLPEGNYFWSVQAIDNAYLASAFAEEQEALVCHPISLGNDTSICSLEYLDLNMGTEVDEIVWHSREQGIIGTGNDLHFQILEDDSVYLTLEKEFGCVLSASIKITPLALPEFNLGTDTAVCYQEQIELQTDPDWTEVNWYSALSGSLATDQENYSHLVDHLDTLWAEVFNADGCVAYDTIIIAIDNVNLPQFELGVDTAVCYLECLPLSVGSGWAETNWYSRSSGLLDSVQENYLHQTLLKDTIWAEVYGLNGCVNYDTIVVDRILLPEFSLGSDTSICYQENIELSPGAGWTEVNWYSLRSGLLLSDQENYTHQVLEKDTIWAEVFNASGCVNYDTIIVDVILLPEFSLGSDTSICYQENIELGAGQGWTEVNWHSLRSGLLLSDQENYTHQVLEKDTIWAEVFNASGCVNYDTIIVDVILLPEFNLGSDTSICYQENIELSAGQGWAEVNWYSLHSGLLLSDQENYTHQVLEKDTIWAEVFNAIGCVNYDTIVVDMILLPGFNLGSDTSICYQENIELRAGDGWANVNWYSFRSGLLLSDQENYTHQVLEKDTIWAEVFNVSGCVNYDTIVVDVILLPEFSLGSDTSICFQENIELRAGQGWAEVNWHSLRSGLLLSDQENYTHQALEKDTIWAEVFNASGCVNYDTIVVDMILLPEFNLGSDTSICYQEEIELSAGAGWAEVNWYSLRSGLLLNDQENNIHQVLEKDTIWAEVFNANGCVNYDTVVVDVILLPEFSIGSDTSICYQKNIELNAGQGWANVNWYSLRSGLLLSDQENYTHQVLEKDTIWAEVFNVSGCVNYDTIVVDMNPLPEFSLGADAAICYMESITLSPSGDWPQINWFSVKNGLLFSDTSIYSHQVIEKDSLWAEVFNANGCVNYDTVSIDVLTLPQFSLGNDTSVCFKQYLALSPGQGWSEVNWYSKRLGLLAANEETYAHQVLETDTLWAEVFDANACVNYDTILVRLDLEDLPQFNLGADTSICYQESIALQVEGSWESVHWYVAHSGSLDSGSQNYLHQVLKKDTLWAEVFNARGCVNYDSIVVDTYALPQFYLGNDTSICFQESIELRAGDHWTAVHWYSARLGNLASHQASYIHRVLEKDTIWAEAFNEFGCVGYDTLIIDVFELPQFHIGADTSICFQQSVPLTSGSGWEQVNWYSAKEGLLLPGDKTYIHQVLEEDSVWAEAFNSFGCVNYDTVWIEVLPLPQFSIGSDTTLCFQELIPLTAGEGWARVDWYSQRAGLLAADQPNYVHQAILKDTLWVELTNTHACVNYDTLVVNFWPLPAFSLGQDTAVCFQESIELSVGSHWPEVNWYSRSKGLLTTAEEYYTHLVLANDTLWAEVYNDQGCVNYDTMVVLVDLFHLPQFSLGADTSICSQESILLNPGSSWSTVNWYSSAKGLLASDREIYHHQVLETDTLWAEVYDFRGCVNSDSLTIRLTPLPVFSLGQDTALCIGDPLFLQVGPGWQSVAWHSQNEGLLNAEDWFYEHNPQASNDLLWVEVMASTGCINYDTLSVLSRPLPTVSMGEDLNECWGNELEILLEGDFAEAHWFSGQNSLQVLEGKSIGWKVTRTDTLYVEAFSQYGCKNFDTLMVSSLDLPIAVLPAHLEKCENDTLSIVLNVSEWSSIEWLSESGTVWASNVGTLPVSNNLSQSYVARVISPLGCVQSDTVLLTVNPLPVFDLGDDREACFGDSILLNIEEDHQVIWRTLDGQVVSDEPTFQWFALSNNTFVAELENEFGCFQSDSIELLSLPLPQPEAGEDRLICFGATTQLGSEGNPPEWFYQWQAVHDTLVHPSAARPTVSPNLSTLYNLLVSDEQGCLGQDSVRIEVNASPHIDPGPEKAICIGESMALGGSPTASGSVLFYQYEWSPSQDLSDAYSPNPVASPSETTRYKLRVRSGDCSEDSAFVWLKVHPLPILSITADTTIGAGSTVPLWVAGGIEASWVPSSGLSSTTELEVEASPLVNTLYTATVNDNNGCVAQASMHVFVRNLLFIPELFSPNDDGNNDLFKVYGYGFKNLSLRIYNIQGILVYQSHHVESIIQQGWDGRYQGKAQEAGNYIWHISGTYYDGQEIDFNGKKAGTLKLIR